MSIPRALGFDNDEIIGGSGGGSNKKSSKSKKYPASEHTFIFLRLALLIFGLKPKQPIF